MKSLSRVWLFATPWTVACQAPLSVGFSRQEYWSGLPFPSPGDLPNPGIEPRSPALYTDAFTVWATPGKSPHYFNLDISVFQLFSDLQQPFDLDHQGDISLPHSTGVFIYGLLLLEVLFSIFVLRLAFLETLLTLSPSIFGQLPRFYQYFLISRFFCLFLHRICVPFATHIVFHNTLNILNG